MNPIRNTRARLNGNTMITPRTQAYRIVYLNLHLGAQWRAQRAAAVTRSARYSSCSLDSATLALLRSISSSGDGGGCGGEAPTSRVAGDQPGDQLPPYPLPPRAGSSASLGEHCCYAQP